MKQITEKMKVSISESLKKDSEYSYNAFDVSTKEAVTASTDELLALLERPASGNTPSGVEEVLNRLNQSYKAEAYTAQYAAVKAANVDPEALAEKWINRESDRIFKERSALGKPISAEKAREKATMLYSLRSED